MTAGISTAMMATVPPDASTKIADAITDTMWPVWSWIQCPLGCPRGKRGVVSEMPAYVANGALARRDEDNDG